MSPLKSSEGICIFNNWLAIISARKHGSLKGQNVWNMICLFYHHWSGDRKMSNCINLICIELSWAPFPLDFDWIVPFGNCWKREKAFFLYGTAQIDLWNSTCKITGWRKILNCIMICLMFCFRSARFSTFFCLKCSSHLIKCKNSRFVLFLMSLKLYFWKYKILTI